MSPLNLSNTVSIAKLRARRVLERMRGQIQLEEATIVHTLFKSDAPGVLIEVGANNGDPTFQRFVIDGWRVFAFEPDPANREDLERRMGSMPNLTVVPKAVAHESGIMTLYRSPESAGISSLAPFRDSHQPALEVEVVTLADFVRGPPYIASVDFLKIDTEGYEKFVMDGYPWDTHRPKAVLVEFEDRKTVPLGYSWSDLADRLQGLEYSVLVSEWFPVARYGVAHRWRRYAQYPTELEDPDAWGNLLAVEPEQFQRLRRLAAAQSGKPVV